MPVSILAVPDVFCRRPCSVFRGAEKYCAGSTFLDGETERFEAVFLCVGDLFFRGRGK